MARPAKTTEQFILDARAIHGDKYQYGLCEYIHSRQHVIVTCETHGDFPIKPVKHMKGQGCAGCAGNRKKDTKQFILDSSRVHKNKYDYSLVEYVNSESRVRIICPDHGEFTQRAANHTFGNGCGKCVDYGSFGKGHINSTNLSKDPEWASSDYHLYRVKFEKDGVILWKIGLERNEGSRWGKSYRGWKVTVVSTDKMALRDAYNTEQAVIRDNSGIRYQHCDFIGNGATEMFNSEPNW